MCFSKMSIAQAIRVLIDMSCSGPYKESLQSEMFKLIVNIEKQFPESGSCELEYRLGIALRNYTSCFVRGDDRRTYFQRAVLHLEKAYILSEGVIPEGHSPTENYEIWFLDRNTIASEIGALLIEEAIIRDIKKGISYLSVVFNNTTDYHPLLCSYAEAFYKLGEYLKAAEIALELCRRVEISSKWREIGTPPALKEIIAKAYRTKAKQHMKNKEIEQAINFLQKLIELSLATDNDRKLLGKLQVAERK